MKHTIPLTGSGIEVLSPRSAEEVGRSAVWFDLRGKGLLVVHVKRAPQRETQDIPAFDGYEALTVVPVWDVLIALERLGLKPGVELPDNQSVVDELRAENKRLWSQLVAARDALEGVFGDA